MLADFNTIRPGDFIGGGFQVSGCRTVGLMGFAFAQPILRAWGFG
jgi:hypothetical protein